MQCATTTQVLQYLTKNASRVLGLQPSLLTVSDKISVTNSKLQKKENEYIV